ncbi:hypothetical protein SLA2020_484520 [Shorea laevis]
MALKPHLGLALLHVELTALAATTSNLDTTLLVGLVIARLNPSFSSNNGNRSKSNPLENDMMWNTSKGSVVCLISREV